MMKFCAISTILLLTFAASLVTKGEGKRNPCPYEGFYKNPNYNENRKLQKCLRCTSCPPSHGVVRPCTGTNDTVCAPCKSGTFSTSWSNIDQCRPCTACAPNQLEKSKCSTNRDTKCGKCKVGYYLNGILDICESCSWCFPDVIAGTDLIIVADCVHQEIPSNYQCARLTVPPYQQETWPQKMKEVEENAEASAERISFIPNDDEEIDNEIDQQLQSEVNTRTQKTPKMENEKLMHKTTESEIETLTQKTIEVETTETTESNLPKVLKIIKHSSINSRTIPTLWQNKRTTSPKSDQTINLVLLGIVSAFFVWLLIVTILLVTLYRKFIDSRKRKKTLICSSNYFQGSLSEKDV